MVAMDPKTTVEVADTSEKRLVAQEAVTAAFARHIAVVIGVNSYPAPIHRLTTAVADASAVADLLEKEQGFEVGAQHRMLDEDATKSNVLARLESLANELTAEDRLVIYFACHGVAKEREKGGLDGYLVLYGEKNDDDIMLKMVDLHVVLSKFRCRHLLLVLDCCFAAAYRWSIDRNIRAPGLMYAERFDYCLKEKAWQLLTSAMHDELALDTVLPDGELLGTRETNETHSPFAQAFMDGLRGMADVSPAAKDGKPAGDGIVTATELILHLREKVPNNARAYGNRQTPVLHTMHPDHRGEFVFIVPGKTDPLESAVQLGKENNPYRGLSSYDEDAKELFFGRKKSTEALVDRIRTHALTVVMGPSGSGKSSLVHAGAIPHLKNGGEWFVVPFRPGKFAMKSLDAALGVYHAPEKRMLLVVDQLEELVTARAEGEDPGVFLDKIKQLLDERAERVHVVMTLRSDFEFRLPMEKLGDHWKTARFNVPAPNREELSEMIQGPARERVLFFEPPALVERIIEDVVNAPGVLPLLSFALSELYLGYLESGAGDRKLRATKYDEIGGAYGALWKRAETLYGEFARAGQGHDATMKRIFLRMVSFDGKRIARRRVDVQELHTLDENENARVIDVLTKLTDARLVVGDDAQQSRRSPRELKGSFEPAHDALMTGLRLLGKWLDEAGDDLHLQRRMTASAEEWARNDRQVGLLWHENPRLAIIAGWLDEKPPRVSTLEAEFGQASVAQRNQRAEDERRRLKRNQRWLGGGVALALILAGISTYFPYRASVERKNAEEQRDTAERATVDAKGSLAEVLKQQGGREWDALALGIESVGSALVKGEKPSERYVDTFFAAFERTRQVVTYRDHDGGDNQAGFFLDDHKVATISDEVHIWDANTGRRIFDTSMLHYDEKAGTVKLVANGKMETDPNNRELIDDLAMRSDTELWFIRAHRSVWKFDLTKNEGLRIWNEIGSTKTNDEAFALSPNAKYILTFSTHKKVTGPVAENDAGPGPARQIVAGTVRVWDTDNKHPVATLDGDIEAFPYFWYRNDKNRKVAFSTNGEFVGMLRSDRKTLDVWEMATGKKIRSSVSASNRFVSFALGADRDRAALIGEDGSIWGPKLSDENKTNIDQRPESAAISFNRAQVAIHARRRLWVYPLQFLGRQSMKPSAELLGFDGNSAYMDWSPNGRKLLWAQYQGPPRIWRPGNLGSIRQVELPCPRELPSLSEGRWYACDNSIYDLERPNSPLQTITGLGKLVGIAVSPQGNRALVTGIDARFEGEDGLTFATGKFTFAVLDFNGKTFDNPTAQRTYQTSVRTTNEISNAVFSSDGARVVLSTGDGAFQVLITIDANPRSPLDIIELKLKHTNATRTPIQPDGEFDAKYPPPPKMQETSDDENEDDFYPLLAAFARDGRRLLTLAPNGTLQWFDPSSAKIEFVTQIEDPHFAPSAISVDARRVAWYKDGYIHELDPSVPKAVTRKKQESFIYSLLYSPDGALLAGESKNGIYVWRSGTLELVHLIPVRIERMLGFVNNNQQIAVVMKDGTIAYYAVRIEDTVAAACKDISTEPQGKRVADLCRRLSALRK